MPRLAEKQYQRRVNLTMLVYVVAMLLVWPLTRSTPELWLKALLACVPALPMLYVIALMARKVAQSDEFEQRMHLVALGVSSALIAALSLVGGLLAAAGAVHLDGSVLIWGFPIMLITYSVSRWWVITRRYGGTTECEGGSIWSVPLQLLLVTALMGLIALVAWWRGRLSDIEAGLLLGMGASSLLFAIVWAARQLRRRTRERTGTPDAGGKP